MTTYDAEQDWPSDPDWRSTDHIELTDPDESADRPRRSIPLRWGLTAAGLAAVGALAGGVLYVHQTRTIVSTRVLSSPGQATANLTGCPVGAACSWSQLPDGGPLFHAVQHLLPTVTVVQAEAVYDNGTAREYLVRLVAGTPDGIQLTVIATRDRAGRAVPDWRSALPQQGPADIALVVPGRRPGTAVAVTATVPAGVPVPAAALQTLATDPSLQLAP
ncbi:MAG TPA: hypothetical protein VJ851_12290 [Jatrophihabitans sp.]|nr:hypothetical protein [Jatrophihabitans sp.]